MIRRRVGLAGLLFALVLAGCAGTRPAPTAAGPPRVRCLSEGARDTASGTRPLVFLFCVESP